MFTIWITYTICSFFAMAFFSKGFKAIADRLPTSVGKKKYLQLIENKQLTAAVAAVLFGIIAHFILYALS